MPKPALTLDPCRIPAHIAVIMDGNGRWAKARGLDRSEGHAEGVNTVHRITQRASDIGVKWLTLYTFSTENWRRPQAEVDALMTLIGYAIERETPGLLENNVRLRVIGDFGRMPEAARRSLQGCMDATAGCTGLNLVLAISYSARWEIAEAARTLARRAAEGKLDPEAITEQTVADALTTAGPAATAGSATTCSGRQHTPRLSSPTHSGPTSPPTNSATPSPTSSSANAALE